MRTLGRQATLNKVWKHLRKQGEKSTNGGHLCRYRGAGGLRCAVGALMPDGMYDPCIEGTSAYRMFEINAEMGRERVGEQFRALFSSKVSGSFIQQLQNIHDKFEPYAWEMALEAFARENNLKALPV